ncbi:creatininase family protein [soil metagenome]
MIYGELTSPDLGRIASKTVALLPIAAVEQHGNHLPVITDTALVTEVARRAEAALPKKVALLPTLWVGSSHHHLGFPGTVSIRSETYVLVLKDLIDSLLKSGFRRIVLLNGHGGNVNPASEALYRVALEHPEINAPWVSCATYWGVARKDLAAQDFMESPNLTHACEYETSMMLNLRADWVRMGQAKGRRAERHSKFYDPLSYTPSRVAVSETFAQMTDLGAMGSPEKATAEKGGKLFDLVAKNVVEFLDEFSTWKFARRSRP